MVETDNYDECVKLKHDNEKLKTTNTIVLETLDHYGDLILENKKLKEEKKRLEMVKMMMNLERRTRRSNWRKNISRPA